MKKSIIIAEIAQAHDGSLGLAHAYIDAVAKTGADVIKFQTHIADEESSVHEPWRKKFSYVDETRFEYWKRMEFDKNEWLELQKHAEDKGLIFISSPFSILAVEWLEEMNIPFWKVASGETNNLPMIDKMIETGKPIILSSGMSYQEDIDEAIRYIQNSGVEVRWMQCTSAYPTQPEDIGVDVIKEYKEKYNILTGFSDHSGKIYACLAALAKGADMIEVHVTMSKDMFGPDVSSSITLDELALLVEGRDYYHRMNNGSYDKNGKTDEVAHLKKLFNKSIMAARTISKASLISLEDLKFVKPLNGIPANAYKEVIEREVKHEIQKGAFIQWEDLH